MYSIREVVIVVVDDVVYHDSILQVPNGSRKKVLFRGWTTKRGEGKATTKKK